MRPMPQPLSTQAAALSLTYSLSSNRASYRAAALENVALIQRQTLSTRHRQKEAAPKDRLFSAAMKAVFNRAFPDYISAQLRSEFPEFSAMRSEEHTSELQSLMRISYAVFCLKK